MLYIIILVVVAVVVYHWVDKENFYSALIATKGTAKYSAIVTREMAITAKKGFQTSKAIYNAEEMSHKAEYAKAGKSYEDEKFANDKANMRAIKEVFQPIQKTLDDTKAKAEDDFAKFEAIYLASTK